MLIIHCLHGLQGYKDDRYIEIPNDNSERGRSSVGQHVAEDQIERGSPQFISEPISRSRVVYNTELVHLDTVPPHLAREHGKLAMHLLQKSFKLRSLCVVTYAEDADFGF